MGRYDETAGGPGIHSNDTCNLFGEQRRPEPLDGRQGAEMFAGLGPARSGLRELRPERPFLPAVRPIELRFVSGQPFGLARQRAAPAALLRLREGPHRLGRGEHALGEVVDRRVQDAGVRGEEPRPVAPCPVLLQDPPRGGVEESDWFVSTRPRHGGSGRGRSSAPWCFEERSHRLRQHRSVEIGLPPAVPRPDQRERHGGPMHFGKAVELFAHLPAGVYRLVAGVARAPK